jgi:hypothetical protein
MVFGHLERLVFVDDIAAAVADVGHVQVLPMMSAAVRVVPIPCKAASSCDFRQRKSLAVITRTAVSRYLLIPGAVGRLSRRFDRPRSRHRHSAANTRIACSLAYSPRCARPSRPPPRRVPRAWRHREPGRELQAMTLSSLPRRRRPVSLASPVSISASFSAVRIARAPAKRRRGSIWSAWATHRAVFRETPLRTRKSARLTRPREAAAGTSAGRT